MGVPFEALLPYAIMLGVRPSPLINQTQTLTHPTDVRHLGCGPLKDQTHAEWGEKSKAFNRSMGQAECVDLCEQHEL